MIWCPSTRPNAWPDSSRWYTADLGGDGLEQKVAGERAGVGILCQSGSEIGALQVLRFQVHLGRC